MVNFINRRSIRSHFLHQTVATAKYLQNKKQGFSQFYPLALYYEKWPKMTTKLFSVDSYDLKSMPFKFGNAIFKTFEMPTYLMSVGKYTFFFYSVHLLQRSLTRRIPSRGLNGCIVYCMLGTITKCILLHTIYQPVMHVEQSRDNSRFCPGP
jgi:hypothetical protein